MEMHPETGGLAYTRGRFLLRARMVENRDTFIFFFLFLYKYPYKTPFFKDSNPSRIHPESIHLL